MNERIIIDPSIRHGKSVVRGTRVRTESRDAGLLVDFGPEGQPIGLEITAPEQIPERTIPLLK